MEKTKPSSSTDTSSTPSSFEDESSPPGLLSLIDLTTPERRNLIGYISRVKGDVSFDFLEIFLPDTQLFRFLDVFAGETIKVPTREESLRVIGDIQIYTFISRRVNDPLNTPAKDIPSQLIGAASANFSVRRPNVRSSYERIRKILLQERSIT